MVAQPVLSGDPGLRGTLADTRDGLAGARVTWLVDHDDPEGREVCAGLADGRDDVTVDVCPPAPEGVNPKLFKLARALATLDDDDVLLVLDDDTRLPAASLGALLTALGPAAAARPVVATGLPAYLPAEGPWGRLVEQFVDTTSALTYLTSTPLTLNGMTWAARAGDLRRLGGLEPVLHDLTDDLAVARLVLGGGGRIVQTASPQWVSTTVPTAGDYVRLLHRWMVFATILLRRQPPCVAARVVALHGLPPVLLGVAVVGGAVAGAPLTAALVVVGRSLVVAGVQRRVLGRVVHHPLLSLAAELLQPLHVAHAVTRRTVRWRTRTYRVVDATTFRPVP